jgi:hypothetical protein
MDNIKKQEKLNNELDNLVEDTMMLLKTVGVKQDEISEGVTKKIEELESLTKSLEKENVSLQSLPKKIAIKVQEIVPSIADELHKLNQTALENQNNLFNDAAVRFKQLQEESFNKQNAAINDAASRLNQIKEEVEKIDSQRIKRYVLGLAVVVLISISASLGATYAMIKQFPQRVSIQSPNNITVKESEVSLWSSQIVNISGDVKKRGRR